jgi:hypothetical protein
LKLIKNHLDPQKVQNFDVPVFTINREDFEIDDWDLTTKKIVSSIGIISLKYIFNIYFNIHNNK